jgi:hypothetical protein
MADDLGGHESSAVGCRAVNEIRARIHLSSREFLKYYQGVATEVVATTTDGRTLRFPANVLRRFVTHVGVHGLFVFRYDDHGRLIEARKA